MTKNIKLIKNIKSSWPSIIGLIAGGAGGFIYYSMVGCSTGTCPLTSNPYISILWGALLGYLLGDMFRKNKQTKKE